MHRYSLLLATGLTFGPGRPNRAQRRHSIVILANPSPPFPHGPHTHPYISVAHPIHISLCHFFRIFLGELLRYYLIFIRAPFAPRRTLHELLSHGLRLQCELGQWQKAGAPQRGARLGLGLGLGCLPAKMSRWPLLATFLRSGVMFFRRYSLEKEADRDGDGGSVRPAPSPYDSVHWPGCAWGQCVSLMRQCLVNVEFLAHFRDHFSPTFCPVCVTSVSATNTYWTILHHI